MLAAHLLHRHPGICLVQDRYDSGLIESRLYGRLLVYGMSSLLDDQPLQIIQFVSGKENAHVRVIESETQFRGCVPWFFTSR